MRAKQREDVARVRGLDHKSATIARVAQPQFVVSGLVMSETWVWP